MRNPSEGWLERSGTFAEAEAIGAIDTANPEYQKKAAKWLGSSEPLLKKLREHRISQREKDALFNTGFWFVESLPEHQNGESAVRSEKPMMRDLRAAVAEALELVSDEDKKRVRIYSAVGTPVDVYLGIDGFIKIVDRARAEPPLYVTFDYTIRSDKDKARADVLIKELPNPDLEKEKYKAAVGEVRDSVILQYRRKKEKRDWQRGISVGK